MENDTQGAHEALMKLYGRCSFWGDGEHCFVPSFVGADAVKTCRCGAEVSRAANPAGPTDATEELANQRRSDLNKRHGTSMWEVCTRRVRTELPAEGDDG